MASLLARLLLVAVALVVSSPQRARAAEPTTAATPGERSASGAPSAATDGTPTEVVVPEAPPIRRSGHMMAIDASASLGKATGYPNDQRKIDREQYYADTGVAGGGVVSVRMGYAIDDWVTFSLAVQGSIMASSSATIRTAGAGFHVDLFPAWGLGGPWRELGVSLEPGVAYTVADPRDDSPDALVDSGGASHMAIGIFYEGIRAWQFSMGPLLAADFVWSPSASRPVGCVGWRMVYYAGP